MRYQLEFQNKSYLKQSAVLIFSITNHFSTSMTFILPLAPADSSLNQSLQKQKNNGQCFDSCIPLFEREFY